MNKLYALNSIKLKKTIIKRRKGRGPGSSKGKTCGRGQNGQKSKAIVPLTAVSNIWRLSSQKVNRSSYKKNTIRTFVITKKMKKYKTIDKKPTFQSLKEQFELPFYIKKIKIIGAGKTQVFKPHVEKIFTITKKMREKMNLVALKKVAAKDRFAALHKELSESHQLNHIEQIKLFSPAKGKFLVYKK